MYVGITDKALRLFDAPQEADSDYPVLYRAAEVASGEGQKTYKRLAGADLSLVVLGAVLGALAFLVPASYAAYFAAVAAIVLLGSIVAKYVNKQRSDDKEWFDGRAHSLPVGLMSK